MSQLTAVLSGYDVAQVFDFGILIACSLITRSAKNVPSPDSVHSHGRISALICQNCSPELFERRNQDLISPQ